MLRPVAMATMLALLPSLALAAPGPRHGDLSVLREVSTPRKAVALTIDLGESATRPSAEALIRWLDTHHVKATFFITGWFIRTFPDLTRQLAANGHQFGNHTDTHPHCRRLSRGELTEQLRNVEELLRRQGLSVREPRYFRPPFGEYSQRVVDTAAELGYRTVIWSATGVDYNRRGDAGRWARSILRQVRPGGIILTHATPVSAEMVPQIVTALQARGYTVVTLGELVGPPASVPGDRASGRSASERGMQR